jgi:hypothetical protein
MGQCLSSPPSQLTVHDETETPDVGLTSIYKYERKIGKVCHFLFSRGWRTRCVVIPRLIACKLPDACYW